MRIIALLSALLGFASARIVGVAAPSELAAGADFEVTLITENYIQSVLDVSAAVGLSPVVFPDTLGVYVGSFHLGPEQSNILTNITYTLNVPSSQPLGPTNLETAVTSLYGASSSPTTIIWSLAVTITNATGSDLISSFDGTNICSTATSPSASASASATTTPAPTDLNTLIQTLQLGLTNLQNTIIQSNTAAGQTQYNAISPNFDRIFFLANIDLGGCPQPPPGRTLTQLEALQTIQGIQASLNLVALDVANGDAEAAVRDACAARAAYFNSGLREYVFGPTRPRVRL